jgi:hypothetical protein
MIVVDYDILWFYVSMHDTLAVGKVQSFENLIDVMLAVTGSQHFQQLSVISGRHVLHHQTVHFSLPYDVQQLYAIVATPQSHQDLDFSVDLPKFD